VRVEASQQSADFSLKIIVRILEVLSSRDSMTRTSLASKTKLNYTVLTRYLKLMGSIGWVEISFKDQKDLGISPIGRDFLHAFTRYQSEVSRTKNLFQENLAPVYPEQRCEILGSSHQGNPSMAYAKARTDNSERDHRIMIVDDEPDNLVTYKVFLTRAGYAVDSFIDSREALRQLMANPPSHYDLVITDIRMPALNGLQLYHKAVEYAIRTEFLFLTALDAIEEITSVIPKIGRFQIVRKPVDETTFLEIVKFSLMKTIAKSIYAETGK